MSDSANCGACGTVCGDMTACAGGTCVAAPPGCTGNGVPGGLCSLPTGTAYPFTACAYDKDCPTGETCVAPTPRFVDNGNGTVTDNRTCLVWEKKTGTVSGNPVVCAAATCPDPHNVENTYTWSTGSPWNFDGTSATVFLAQLNGGGFAGHTDWRLPTSAGYGNTCAGPCATGQDPELESILVAPYPCTASPCIDSMFGPTENAYWSSSWSAKNPSGACYVSFWNQGLVYCGGAKYSAIYVRAVRGGP